MTVENVHGFANGAAIPPYFLQQQQQMTSDFIPPMKVDLPWEPSRSMADLQDKPHVRSRALFINYLILILIEWFYILLIISGVDRIIKQMEPVTT